MKDGGGVTHPLSSSYGALPLAACRYYSVVVCTFFAALRWWCRGHGGPLPPQATLSEFRVRGGKGKENKLFWYIRPIIERVCFSLV